MFLYSRCFLLSVLLQWGFLCREALGAFVMTIQPGDEECFTFRTPLDQAAIISGSFEAIEDDVEAKELAVSFSNSNTGAVLYNAPTGTREGNFRLDHTMIQPDSRYLLCFQNNDSDDDSENDFDVGFSVHFTNPPRALKEGEIGPDGERALKLVEKAIAIQEDWTNMEDHFDFVRNREALHREMHNSILSRLRRWNNLEILVVIGMATLQVMYWKKFFETRRYL